MKSRKKCNLFIIFSFVLIVLVSSMHFSAVVSDNDGSAFISKAEFDSLKNDFQNQIDQYNTSIDNKIDVAIASYLAGIKFSKTTEGRFDIFGNQNILIVNTKNVDNLKFGKVGIDWDINFGQVGIRTTYTNCAVGTIKMTRTGDNNYEAFIIDNSTGKFKYWGDSLKINTKVNFALQKAVASATSYYNDDSTIQNLKLRWGANAYSYARRGEDENRHDDEGGSGSIRWSNYFGKNTFYSIYATGLNFGNLFWSAGSQIYKSNISTVKVSNDKALWIIDDSDDTTQVWAKNPEQDPKVLTTLEATNYITTSRSSSLPSDAGISGNVSVTSVNIDFRDTYDATLYPNRLKRITVNKDLEWTRTGSFNNITSTATSASDWVEFHLVTNKSTPSTTINENFTTAQLAEYAPYGFKGYLTQGLPIGIFKADSSIRFTLDTSTAGRNINFAVKSTPFDTSDIENLTDDSGITLKIDGSEYPDVASITAASHTIEIANSKQQALFVKMAIPRSESSKERLTVSWPLNYLLTDNS